MNQEHLMKHTLRQMEREAKSSINKKKVPQSIFSRLSNALVVNKRLNVKGGMDHD